MHKINFFLILIITIVASCNKDDETKFTYTEDSLQIGGNSLQVYHAGSGQNTILFESGLGVDGQTWFENDLLETIANDNQVIAYNRAGYTPSTYGNEDRNLNRLSSDLAEIINQLSVNEKVILVGHSLGGAIIRNFAINNPTKVKAILFVDPNHEDYDVYAAITQIQEDETVQQLIDASNIGGSIEAKQLIENLDILNSLPNVPNVPIIVLTSIKVGNGLSQLDREDWSQAHQTLGNGISNFNQIETNKSGHFIYLEEPELIISSLNQLIK